MNLKNHGPVYVPDEYQDEIEQLSKAALMDMVWDYAMQFAGVTDDVNGGEKAMAQFRDRREIILRMRKRVPELLRNGRERTLQILADRRKA